MLNKGRTLAGRATALALGAVLGVAVVELLARLLFPAPSPQLADSALQIDSEYGLSYVPSASGWFTSPRGEYSTYVEINSQGLRDVERGYVAPDGVPRILVLGDSMTAALQVPLAATYPKVAEDGLRRLAHRHGWDGEWEVINAGIVGYGTANELRWYAGEGREYGAELVVLAFFSGNDVTDNVNPPLFERRGGELVRLPVEYSADRLPSAAGAGKGMLRSARRFAKEHSRLYSVAIEPALLALVRRSPDLVERLVALGLVEVARPPMNLGNSYAYLSPPESAWKMTEMLVQALKQEVEGDGARLVALVLPDEAEVSEDRRQELLAAFPELKHAAGFPFTPSTRAASLFAEHDIPVLDVSSELAAGAQGDKEPLYFRYDGHLTEEGHRIVGEALADYLADILAAAQGDRP